MKKDENFLSLDWFKERVEKSIDKAVAKGVNKLLDKELIPDTAKPYLSLKLVNDSLIVVLRDGNIFTKPNATELDYERVRQAASVDEIFCIIEDVEVAQEKKEARSESERLTNLAEGFNAISYLSDFVVTGNSVALAGTSRTIPPLLVDKFAEVVGRYRHIEEVDALESALKEDDEYIGLKNFFMWCCLNPRAEVADSLYGFLDKNGMKITKQGFFVALRNVVNVNANDDGLVSFVTNSYNKIKAVWKKNPSNFRVMALDNGEYDLENTNNTKPCGTIIGNLTSLYLDLPNMVQNRYTDSWTRTFDIRIGQVVGMPKEKANWSTQDCATAGLHFAGHTAPYVLCGDTTVFTLHNPMKVVGIGREKGRCWEYLPFMTTTVKEANKIMNSKDFDFLQLDEEYAIRELEDLANRAKEGFTVESTKYDYNLPSISTAEINSIVLSLEEMKASITKRVNIID